MNQSTLEGVLPNICVFGCNTGQWGIVTNAQHVVLMIADGLVMGTLVEGRLQDYKESVASSCTSDHRMAVDTLTTGRAIDFGHVIQ